MRHDRETRRKRRVLTIFTCVVLSVAVFDWTADPRVLAATKFDGRNPPFRVVWARSGNITTWSSSEPNELLWRYFQDHRSAVAQPEATER